jgi:hypothetical protein
MTNDDLQHLRFNAPLYSNIDGTTWYYDCRGDGLVKIFKGLIDTPEDVYQMGRYRIYSNWGNSGPWKRKGSLTVPLDFFMESFELVFKIVKDDLSLIKKSKSLTEPYSIVNPNFHMMGDLF